MSSSFLSFFRVSPITHYLLLIFVLVFFKFCRDNYGFVTFAYKVDAYEAVERGNDDPTQPHYELCFGGRRKFCRERYADLGKYLPLHILYSLDIGDLFL